MCFEEALKAAKNTKNPIIPIDCLEALAEATKSHESAGDEIKGQAVDYIFENYQEWRDAWSDLVYKGMMEIDKRLQAENKKKNKDKVELASKLLGSGVSLEEAAKIIDDFYNNGNPPVPTRATAKQEYKVKSEEEADTTVDTCDVEKLILDTPDDIVKHVTGMFPDRGGRLPDAIWVNYYKYWLGMPFSYMMRLNNDKKTYRIENVSEAQKLDYDKELDNPSCYMVIWYWDSKEKGIEVRIPLAKGHVPEKFPK